MSDQFIGICYTVELPEAPGMKGPRDKYPMAWIRIEDTKLA